MLRTRRRQSVQSSREDEGGPVDIFRRKAINYESLDVRIKSARMRDSVFTESFLPMLLMNSLVWPVVRMTASQRSR
jgi:hypothetical protein